MTKQKQLSKSFIASIVLAIMLVFSLTFSATGAWFTDTQTVGISADISFATVAVGVTANEHAVIKNIDGETVTRNILPGDQITVGGNLNNATSDVNIYVYVTFTDVEIAHFVSDEDDGTSITSGLEGKINGGTFSLLDGTDEATPEHTDDSGNKCYLLEYEEGKTTQLGYTSSIELDTSIGNTVTANGKIYVLNNNSEVQAEIAKYRAQLADAGTPEEALDAAVAEKYVTGGAYKIKGSVTVYAIQADNITAQEALAELLSMAGVAGSGD